MSKLFRMLFSSSSTSSISSSGSPTTSALTPATIVNKIITTSTPTITPKTASASTQTTKMISESVSTISQLPSTAHPLLNDVYKFMREGIVSSIFFLILMIFSHFLIRRYIRKKDDEKKIFIPRILCTICLSISIAAMLLIPITIISNEIMTTFPESYYTQWLDRELIFSFWNKIFWGANISLFIILPFTYFLYESEGIRGRSLLNRVKEALLILSLVAIIFVAFVFIIFKLFYGQQKQPNTLMESIKIISTDYLPFSYSLISTFGTLLVMWLIPNGFNFLISKCISLRIVRPVEDEIKAAKMEIESITFTLNKAEAAGFVNLKSKKSKIKKRRQSNCITDVNSSSNSSSNNNNNNVSTSSTTDNEKNGSSLKSDKMNNSNNVNNNNNNNSDITSPSSNLTSSSSSSSSASSASASSASSISPNLPSSISPLSTSSISPLSTSQNNIASNAIDSASTNLNTIENNSNNNNLASSTLNDENNSNSNNVHILDTLDPKQQYQYQYQQTDKKKLNQQHQPDKNFKITQQEIQRLEDTREELYIYIDKISRPSYFSSTILRILTSFLLTLINFAIKGWVIFKVFISIVKKIFELFELEQIKSYFDSWMSSAIDLSKGSSKLGPFESLFETTIIIYLMISAFVGFLNESHFSKIKPRIHSTSLRKMIINTGIILLMSSSFPVVVRTLEISRFDLMGYYSHTHYLRNDGFKMFYRISFLIIVARSYMASFIKSRAGVLMMANGNGGDGTISISDLLFSNLIFPILTSDLMPTWILNKLISNSTRNKIQQQLQFEKQQQLLIKQQKQLQQQTNVVKSIHSLALNQHHQDQSTSSSSSSSSQSLFSIIAKNQNLINIQDDNNSIGSGSSNSNSPTSPSVDSYGIFNGSGSSIASSNITSPISSAPSSPSLKRISSTNNNNNSTTNFKNKKSFFF